MTETQQIDLIKRLASTYEEANFLNGDPSWFMHQVKGEANQEMMAFLAASLSFGARKQFLPKIQHILDCAQGDVYNWLKEGKYDKDIPQSEKCFYRLYNYTVMNSFCAALSGMIAEYGTLKQFVCSYPKPKGEGKLNTFDVLQNITSYFADKHLQGLIPKDTQSSCKRLCMFLRWMVRDKSPVDIGIWSDTIDKRTLIMPMDTHVLQQALQLGLISNKNGSMSTARKLTAKMLEIFPDDPLKADFALFGLGTIRL